MDAGKQGKAVQVSNRKAAQVEASGRRVIKVRPDSVRVGRWVDKEKEQAEMKSRDKPGVGMGSTHAESGADQISNRESTQERVAGIQDM